MGTRPRIVRDYRYGYAYLFSAGWHQSRELEIRANVSLLKLQSCSPELNPVEAPLSVLKHRHFANRVFESAEHVRETVEEASNGFTSKTGEIMQITAREWAAL